MNLREVQKIIKTKTDNLFQDYKGKILIGGNITHTKKTDKGKNIIFQSLLSYNHFPVNCNLQVENNIITFHYQNAFSDNDEKNFIPVFTIDYLKPNSNNRFEINNLDDIDVWMNFLKESLENKEEIFIKFSNLDNLQEIINKNILSNNGKEVLSIHEYEIINGLIASKILEKPYFEDIYKKYIRIAEQNDYPERTVKNVKTIYNYLKNLKNE